MTRLQRYSICCASFFAFQVTLAALPLQAQQQCAPPALDSLLAQIDTFYSRQTAAQFAELADKTKYRWLAYLPNPGYSPFTGGFTLSFNLMAPLGEINQRHLAKMKRESILRMNSLEAAQLKAAVVADHEAFQFALAEYHSKDSLIALRTMAFSLFTAQYNRHEITPSEFLSKQMEMESLRAARIVEANRLCQMASQLRLKAKLIYSNVIVF
jgi:hypothetical protein